MANKVLIVAFVIAVVAALSFSLKNGYSDKTKNDVATTPEPSTAMPSGSTDTQHSNIDTSTIAKQWQWAKLKSQDNGEVGSKVTLPFTPQSVHDALQAVKIDSSGNVVLDHDALLSLDEALERIYNKLDGDSMQQLGSLIEQALPGTAGKQTAKLVEDYNRFLKAKEEFSQVYEGSPPAYDQQSVASIESDEALYAELQALRQVHLGENATSKLFGVSDANAQFMFDSMKLELDKTLTPEQRNQRRLEIQEQLDAAIAESPDR